MHFAAPPCPSCGERHGVLPRTGDLYRCDACGALFRRSGSGEPELPLGDLLQRPDLSAAPIPGWNVSKPEFVRFDRSRDELVMSAPGGPNLVDLLRSAGYFADIDLSLSARLLKGDPTDKHLGVGVGLRWTYKDGVCGYLIECRMNGRLAVLRYDKGKSESLLPYTEHSAQKLGLGAQNRLRVVIDGPRIRVYLNGHLASDLHDDGYKQGVIRVFVSPSDTSHAEFGFSEIELREPRARWI